MTEYIAVIKEDIASSSEHRFLRLPHPRTGQPQLYLPHTSNGGGICEVVKVGGANGRTWFIGDDKVAPGNMLVYHPIDPLFLAIPVAISLLPANDSQGHFQPLADLLATAAGSEAFALRPAFSPTADPEVWNPDAAKLGELKCFKRGFKACCEKKLITSTSLPSPPPEDTDTNTTTPTPGSSKSTQAYYRPSLPAIIALLQQKVDRLASTEQYSKFDHLQRGLGRDGLLEPGADENVVQLARIKGAMETIGQYLPDRVGSALMKAYDFAPLETHLEARRAAALAAAAPSISSKSDKSSTSGAGAKRKAKETSQGVKKLSKVNTAGMSKMTSFFKPKAAK